MKLYFLLASLLKFAAFSAIAFCNDEFIIMNGNNGEYTYILTISLSILFHKVDASLLSSLNLNLFHGEYVPLQR